MSNIYEDLRKFKPPQKLQNAPPTQTTIQPIAQLTIDDIVELSRPLEAIRDNIGYVHDNISIILRCCKMHIHKYFISDIAKGKIKCTTCTMGTARTRMIREFVEECTGIPFVIVPLANTVAMTEYINPVTNMTIRCTRARNECVYDGGIILYIYSNSVNKIKKIIESVGQICMKNQIETPECFRVKDIQHRRYIRARIPMSPELADANLAANPGASLAQITRDNNLYIENC